MTFVLCIATARSTWIVADTRLSGARTRDDGVKVLRLETVDGHALVGYAGLGTTARGVQPSDWMANVLRSRSHTVEESLSVIAEAAKAQIPRHLATFHKHGPIVEHHIIAAALVNGVPRVYSMGIAADIPGKRVGFWASRHINGPGTPHPFQDYQRDLRMCMAGTGSNVLQKPDAPKGWRRALIRLVKARDRDALSADAVASHLANLCFMVHRHEMPENGRAKTVGDRCVVAWLETGKPGGHAMYKAGRREPGTPFIPTIVRGIDVLAPARAFFRMVEKHGMNIDQAMLEEELRKLPDGPDERLW